MQPPPQLKHDLIGLLNATPLFRKLQRFRQSGKLGNPSGVADRNCLVPPVELHHDYDFAVISGGGIIIGGILTCPLP